MRVVNAHSEIIVFHRSRNFSSVLHCVIYMKQLFNVQMFWSRHDKKSLISKNNNSDSRCDHDISHAPRRYRIVLGEGHFLCDSKAGVENPFFHRLQLELAIGHALYPRAPRLIWLIYLYLCRYLNYIFLRLATT